MVPLLSAMRQLCVVMAWWVQLLIVMLGRLLVLTGLSGEHANVTNLKLTCGPGGGSVLAVVILFGPKVTVLLCSNAATGIAISPLTSTSGRINCVPIASFLLAGIVFLSSRSSAIFCQLKYGRYFLK